MNLVESAKQIFDQKLARAGGAEKSFRAAAWADYEGLGLPDRKNEYWKYSSLAGIAKKTWRAPEVLKEVPSEVIELREQYQSDCDVLVFVNGRLRMDASVVSAELKACLSAPEFREAAFDDGFTGLSAALSEPGVRVKIPNGLKLLRPVVLLRAQEGEGTWAAAYNEIQVGEGACAAIAELFIGDATAYLRTEVTSAHLESGAMLDWVRLQNEPLTASHFSDVRARVDEGACLRLNQIQMGAAWARSSLRFDIMGKEAEAAVHGIGFGRLHQHNDQRILVNHQSAESRSSQLVKTVLKDNARGVVNGKIYIAQDAQQVSSNQLNHALLLSAGAEADIKPELEIYADDVKANHGAAIGRMDQDKLFYLISRGIRREMAQQMLAQAFVADVLMKIGSRELRALAEERVRRLLPEFMKEMEA